MIEIKTGNCLEVLKTMPEQSVNTCVTSPPFWGLRDYGTAEWEGGDDNCEHTINHYSDNLKPDVDRPFRGNRSACIKCGAIRKDNQLGLEDTPEEYVENMVAVFREVKRVLRDDGTVWLNLGDSYSSGGRKTTTNQTLRGDKDYGVTRPKPSKGIKPKDLIGIPWRVAFALQADGWYLRQDIIWHKPNPMPESVTDRCTKSHEYIFLLSKNKKYYYDNEAIKEDSKRPNEKQTFGGEKAKKNIIKEGDPMFRNGSEQWGREIITPYKRNKRSVWTVTTKPFKGAHFATFPPDLIEPCVLAGCPEEICVECGTPYERKTNVERNLTLEEVEQIRADIVKTKKERKPYAIIEKEFRNQIVEYRNLPKHKELRLYLKEYRAMSSLTIDEIEQHFGTQAPHHWFEKGGSYPDKDDWTQLKELLSLDNTYDQAMTEVFYKSGLKCDNEYLDKGLHKQCQCESNETKAGTVLDPFGGAGTTGLVAQQHNRNAVLIELNPEYAEMAKNRIYNDAPLFADVR
jgi:site-specific DNA-methyltransferase (adenine-specific)